MNLFYAPGLNKDDIFCTLDADESNHCTRSMRKSSGQNIMLTNGRGLLAEGNITGTESGRCTVQITKVTADEGRKWNLEIAVAPTKNLDRFEWFAEKASESGIDAIIPLICKHSERRNIQHDRLNRLLIAAIKQSLKSYLPLVMLETGFNELVVKKYNGQKFIAWCEAASDHHLKDVLKKGEDALILIGPEGDFSAEEIDLAKAHGFIPVSLGKNRLRTETAAITACIIANLINA
jgi:16S rRNA (uracil1498-N3)-methyltransferase